MREPSRGRAKYLAKPELSRWEKRLRGLLKAGSGPQKLWAAVLDDAIALLVGNGHHRRHRSANGALRPEARHEWRQALAWILRRDAYGEPYTFEWVCNELALDIEFVRADLCARIASSPRTAEFASAQDVARLSHAA